MQTNSYKENVKEALKNLVRVNESIFNSIIDISLQGELKEWNDSVPIGEAHQFDFEIFRNTGDTNIRLLIKVIETVDATFHSIKNLNAIHLDESES